VVELTSRQSEIANPQTLELMTGTMNAAVILSLTKRVLYQLSTSALQNLELMTGIEPVTSPLPRECSTN
jgi:hypothetical protein